MTERTQIDPQAAVDYMLQAAPRFAKARAQRLYLEEFRKSKKALLMQQSSGKTVSERESDAYAHADYLGVLEGYQVAVEAEETLRWKLKAAELEVDIWRSREASNRSQDRSMR